MPQTPQPTNIQLHSKSRVLSLIFDDDSHFDLPCEYLRVFSPAAEVKADDKPVSGKEQVNITAIEPQGNYALSFVFDDGHDTGIYSWQTLYDLGKQQQTNWQDYLQRLKAHGIERNRGADATQQQRQVTILYFAYLVNKLRKESEQLTLPDKIDTVEKLIGHLQHRERDRGYLLAAEHIQVTVNREFTESFTRLDDGDEIGITPVTPTPPAPPK
jgi:DUF971 family protein/molybdopterin converting factor small subunit